MKAKCLSLARRFAADDRGVTGIEYAILAGLVGVAMIASARALGLQLGLTYTVVTDELKTI